LLFIKGSSRSEHRFFIPVISTENIAATHVRVACGFAYAKAVNLQLARMKKVKDRFDIFVAVRRKVVAEVGKVTVNSNSVSN
jgi:hypothetical protein